MGDKIVKGNRDEALKNLSSKKTLGQLEYEARKEYFRKYYKHRKRLLNLNAKERYHNLSEEEKKKDLAKRRRRRIQLKAGGNNDI